ncbi:MAG: amidohydrolase family protein [Rhodospirillales bacterium]|nr:amidohydrolase family protein [Rhodospirillales bacterium]
MSTPHASTPQVSTLYAGGKVFDGESLLADRGLLVQGERIARIAPLAEFEGFAGTRIDTAGATLLPGLIDCHVHLIYSGDGDPRAVCGRMSVGQIVLTALDNAQASLAGGIAALRDCGGKDYLEFAVRDACNRGTFQGPAIRCAGRMICMTGGHGNYIGRVADGVDEVVKAVREQVHAGSDLIKIMATGGVMTPGVNPQDAHYSPEEIAAGIAEGHRFHRPCASHAQGRDGILNAVYGGIDSIEHGIFMDEVCCQAMLERRTFLVPTLSAVRNILAHAGEGVPDYAVEKARAVAETHRRSIKMYYEAGGRIAMGTDAGTPFNRHGQNALELAYMVEIGMTPADALKAATVNAAELNRMPERGRLAEGKLADLLLVEGDPTQDIAMAAERKNHRFLVKGGMRVAARAAG